MSSGSSACCFQAYCSQALRRSTGSSRSAPNRPSSQKPDNIRRSLSPLFSDTGRSSNYSKHSSPNTAPCNKRSCVFGAFYISVSYSNSPTCSPDIKREPTCPRHSPPIVGTHVKPFRKWHKNVKCGIRIRIKPVSSGLESAPNHFSFKQINSLNQQYYYLGKSIFI